MSLLTAMENMLRNDVAIAVAEEELMFEEDIAMEAEDFIDMLVDKEEPFEYDPEIDGAEDICAEDDEILAEIEDEDNNIGDLGGIDEDGKDTVVGQQNSSPNPDGNVSGAKLDKNDPIETWNGSIGDKKGSANPEGNQSGAHFMKEDDLETENGSVGYQKSTPNPANEAMRFLEAINIEEEVATESEEEIDTEEFTSTEDELSNMNDMLDDFDDEDDLDI